MTLIALTLTLAGLSTQHQASALSYAWPRYMTYTEGQSLYLCTGKFDFTFDGGTAAIGADKCVADVIAKRGFE